MVHYQSEKDQRRDFKNVPLVFFQGLVSFSCDSYRFSNSPSTRSTLLVKNFSIVRVNNMGEGAYFYARSLILF